MEMRNKISKTLDNAVRGLEKAITMYQVKNEQYSKLQDVIYEFICERERR